MTIVPEDLCFISSRSDPSRQARNASLRGSAELTGQPVSEVGLTTR